MPTFYVGYRNVLKGRNSNDAVNPYTGQRAIYSNYSIFNTSHVLDGAPDRRVTLGVYKINGTGSLMAQILGGRPHVEPLSGAGNPVKPFGLYRYRGTVTALGNGGHGPRNVSWSNYNNFIFDGVGIQALAGSGNLRNRDGFSPNTRKGVGPEAMSAVSQPLGGDRPLRWIGVPSAKAL